MERDITERALQFTFLQEGVYNYVFLQVEMSVAQVRLTHTQPSGMIFFFFFTSNLEYMNDGANFFLFFSHKVLLSILSNTHILNTEQTSTERILIIGSTPWGMEYRKHAHIQHL